MSTAVMEPAETQSEAGWIMVEPGSPYNATQYASHEAMRFGPRAYSASQAAFIAAATKSRAPLPEAALKLDD